MFFKKEKKFINRKDIVFFNYRVFFSFSAVALWPATGQGFQHTN